MPSASLVKWQSDRSDRLRELQKQCTTPHAGSDPKLVEENLRSWVLLLSSHLQGFCRDLFIEAVQTIVSKIRSRLQLVIQAQFSSGRALDHGNPSLDNIRKDFDRFGFDIKMALDQYGVSPVVFQHLKELNKCRNALAHGSPPPSAPIIDVPTVARWKNSCDTLTTSIDAVMYNQLKFILYRKPW